MKVTNATQIEKLVEELEKNPTLARGFRRGTIPSNFKDQWEEICEVLKSLGLPRREGDGWQKVWRDLKCKVKKKMVSNKAECNATGGGIYKQSTLSPLEEAVANMLQFEKQLNPVQGVQCDVQSNEYVVTELERHSEVQAETSDVDDLFIMDLPLDQELPSTSKNASRRKESVIPASTLLKENYTPSKRKQNCTSVASQLNSNDRGLILQKHSDEQAKLLKDISNSLTSVKRSLKDVNRFQKKLIDVEDTKLQILQGRNKREEEMHKSEMKIKRLKISIKEKELQLLNKDQQ